jgi:CRISPR type IV-associated protein Csf2
MTDQKERVAAMNYTIAAEGFLTAVTPVAVSPPEHFEEKNRLFLLPREIVYDGPEPRKYPVIPASTFRGALRHAVTGYAFDTLNESAGRKLFRVNDYIWTAQGGVTDRKAEGAEEYVEISKPERVRSENPIMGLFGNFTFKMGSLVEMRAARAEDGEAAIITVPAQVRTDPLERDYGLLGLFDKTDLGAFKEELIARRAMVKSEKEVERLEAQLRNVKDGKKEMKPEEVQKLRDRVDDLRRRVDELGESAGGAVNLQQITTRVEAIAAGSVLRHGWMLKDVSVEEAAVFLLAWRTWTADGARLGAVARSGFGRLTGSYDILLKPSHGPDRLAAPVRAGKMSFSFETGVKIDSAHDVLDGVALAEQTLRNGGMAAWNLKSA